MIIYSSYGLTSLPVRLLRGSKNSRDQLLKKLSDIEASREEIMEKYQTMSPNRSQRISNADKEVLEELSYQERTIKRKIRRLDEQEQSLTQKLFKILRPLEVDSCSFGNLLISSVSTRSDVRVLVADTHCIPPFVSR